MKHTLQNFPTESLTEPWPTLISTPDEKGYRPASETPVHFAARTMYRQSDLRLSDLLVALVKGAILGGMAFALLFGLILNHTFWFTSWHWAFALAGLGLLLFLFGIQRGFLLVALILFLTTVPSMVTRRDILVLGGLFLAGGMIVRGWIELLPGKAAI